MIEITEKDFLQPEMYSCETLKRLPLIKTEDKIVDQLRDDIEQLRAQENMLGRMSGAIMMLMMLGKTDEEIVVLGRVYFVRHVTSSIGILQRIGRDIEEMPSLPNDEECMRLIRLIKETCASLINDFGKSHECVSL